MRQLGALYGRRNRFSGTFVRDGLKGAYRGPGYDETVLLKDIRDEYGNIVADHLWFNKTKGFEELFLIEGEIVSFDARVDDYLKGYKKDGYDYKLSRPTKVKSHGRPDFVDYEPVEFKTSKDNAS